MSNFEASWYEDDNGINTLQFFVNENSVLRTIEVHHSHWITDFQTLFGPSRWNSIKLSTIGNKPLIEDVSTALVQNYPIERYVSSIYRAMSTLKPF